MTPEQLIDKRESTHGDYTDKCNCIWRTKQVWHMQDGWDRLPATHRESLDMIAHKVARILTGNPHHVDHWRDIAGYAQLIVRELEKQRSEIGLKAVGSAS